MNSKPKIIRVTTIPISLNAFVKSSVPNLAKVFDVVFLSSDGIEWDIIRKEFPSLKCIIVPMERHISICKDLVSLISLTRVFRYEKPLLVHSMTPKAGLLCMLAAKFTGVPIRIHTFTGLVFPTALGFKKLILMATDRLTCKCATHIIPEGVGVERDLLNYGITKKQLKVLGYGSCKGIDLVHFDKTPEVINKAKFLMRNDVVTFISVGRLVGDKGINEIVQAFSRLNIEYPKTRLILIGSEEAHLDPLTVETLEEIRENESILAVGNQSDVRPWLVASDVAVLASYREGFPNVVIEAGAMGLPQIVTNINGANEIIIQDKNGLIIPPKDVEALCAAMKRMLDENLRKTLAKNARKMIASRYKQEFVCKCLLDFYNDVINKNCKNSSY